MMIKKIAIHSVPRSGSTWMGQIMNSHPELKYAQQPLFSYALKGYLDENSTSEDIEKFYSELYHSQDDFINQKDSIERGLVPDFRKSESINYVAYKEVRYHYILRNLLDQNKEVKVIGIIRNPLSVISSWLKAPKEFRKDLGWEELEEWDYAPKKNLNLKEEYNGFQKWKEVTSMFEELAALYPDQFKITLYNDLINDTLGETKKIFDFIGISFHPQVEEFINQSREKHNHDAYSVFKKKVNDDSWKKDLHPEIISAIKTELKDSKLEKYL